MNPTNQPEPSLRAKAATIAAKYCMATSNDCVSLYGDIVGLVQSHQPQPLEDIDELPQPVVGDEEPTKVCPKCHQKKPLDQFHHRSGTNRLQSWCKVCTSIVKSRVTYAKNPDLKNQKVKLYRQTPRGKEGMLRQSAAAYLRGPLKASARTKLRYAVKTGKMIKPVECESCKQQKPLQAHHSDYSKPLDVKWLCKSCHWDEHKFSIKV